MSEHQLVGLVSIVIVGVFAQWLAWRLKVPSILLLLLFGFAAGPVTGFIDADELLGGVLFPLVSISVAVILYEGGLTLRLSEYREVRKAVRNLVTIGILVTWVVTTMAAHWILGLELSLAVLLGAILVVTGPTVVIPLLRHVHPEPRVGSLAKWEGIMNDPIGATLAVLVFEAIFVGESQAPFGKAVAGFLGTLLIGVLTGVVCALIIVILLKRYWIPDFLQNPVSLMFVMLAFSVSNSFVTESGLLAVTVMGFALANQKWVAVRHIIEFKENLRVLLISVLFILLASRLEPEQLTGLDWRAAAFVAVLIVLARPLSVFLSTAGSDLHWKDKTFLCFMAPRGIVAAAVASVFSFRLSALGHSQAESLVSITFFIIVITVAFYGLTARTAAQWLGLARQTPQGFLIMGGHAWAREIATVLRDHRVPVLLVDTNRENYRRAREADIPAYFGSVLSEYSLEEMDLAGIGRFLAMTSNEEANSLACLRCLEVFDRAGVYQLAPDSASQKEKKSDAALHLMGRILFDRKATFRRLSTAFGQGAVVKATRLGKEFGFDELREEYERVMPLFRITPEREVDVFSVDNDVMPVAGDMVISLVTEKSAENSR